mmetsp:Transcript_7464/g.11491  ORF Transcript_7464/g.11491 Transcript_7464/m.11491 type:complete len:120 (+) Transcript_7464:110-469(+)
MITSTLQPRGQKLHFANGTNHRVFYKHNSKNIHNELATLRLHGSFPNDRSMNPPSSSSSSSLNALGEKVVAYNCRGIVARPQQLIPWLDSNLWARHMHSDPSFSSNNKYTGETGSSFHC